MAKQQPQNPVSPWLHQVRNGIDYFVHVPSKRCGIHIRGLAQLCGVHHSSIQEALRKAAADLAGLRASKILSLLKGKDIFLDDLAGLSPKVKGKAVKVILSDICTTFIRYYADQGREPAIQSAIKIMDFGMEQFIYIQTGFITRPESILLDEVEYLIAKESVQVTKSRQEEARFFTNPRTGECGIALKSLGFLCGGVALRHVEGFLQAQNDPFLHQEHPEQIVKAQSCAQTLYHFGHVHKPRKTVAQQWAKALDPIVPTLHQKTHYQAPRQSDRETQLEQQLSEAQKEIDRLRQLAKIDTLDGLTQWHLLMGRVLESALPEPFWQVLFEQLTSKVPQYLDALILRRPSSLPSDSRLPDGLRDDVEIGLLTYKSHHESLSLWSIQELIHHYVGYRKELAAQAPDHGLPDAARFQLYAVTTLYPQALAAEMGERWQASGHAGVYCLLIAGLSIQVIVTSKVTPAPHNRPWNLLSNNPALIRYALEQQPLSPDLQGYFDVLMPRS